MKIEELETKLGIPYHSEGSVKEWSVYVVECKSGPTWEHVTGDIEEAFRVCTQLQRDNPNREYQVIDAILVPIDPYETKTLKKKFNELATQWRDETGHFSSVTSKKKHAAYAKMKAMGSVIIPFVLARMKTKQDSFLFVLLNDLVDNPPPVAEPGNIRRVVADWLKWGKAHGYQF